MEISQSYSENSWHEDDQPSPESRSDRRNFKRGRVAQKRDGHRRQHDQDKHKAISEDNETCSFETASHTSGSYSEYASYSEVESVYSETDESYCSNEKSLSDETNSHDEIYADGSSLQGTFLTDDSYTDRSCHSEESNDSDPELSPTGNKHLRQGKGKPSKESIRFLNDHFPELMLGDSSSFDSRTSAQKRADAQIHSYLYPKKLSQQLQHLQIANSQVSYSEKPCIDLMDGMPSISAATRRMFGCGVTFSVTHSDDDSLLEDSLFGDSRDDSSTNKQSIELTLSTFKNEQKPQHKVRWQEDTLISQDAKKDEYEGTSKIIYGMPPSPSPNNQRAFDKKHTSERDCAHGRGKSTQRPEVTEYTSDRIFTPKQQYEENYSVTGINSKGTLQNKFDWTANNLQIEGESIESRSTPRNKSRMTTMKENMKRFRKKGRLKKKGSGGHFMLMNNESQSQDSAETWSQTSGFKNIEQLSFAFESEERNTANLSSSTHSSTLRRDEVVNRSIQNSESIIDRAFDVEGSEYLFRLVEI